MKFISTYFQINRLSLIIPSLIIFGAQAVEPSSKILAEGKAIFRYDTFGDEAYWGDQLRLHEAIKGAKNGGPFKNGFRYWS